MVRSKGKARRLAKGTSGTAQMSTSEGVHKSALTGHRGVVTLHHTASRVNAADGPRRLRGVSAARVPD